MHFSIILQRAKVAAYLFLVLMISEKNGVNSLVIGASTVMNPDPEEYGPYFQGDIILPQEKSGRIDPSLRWQNRTIYYEFEDKYPSNLQSTFLDAIGHISTRTCIKFHPRNASFSSLPPDYIHVTGSVSSACFSYVGRRGGRQVISLPSNCHNLGTFIHELLHVVGFHHEQSRTDRDDHVKINWENVQPGRESQFKKYDAATVSSFGVPYDYASVLHYGRYYFSKDASKLETIVPLVANYPDGTPVEIGLRRGMSEKDAEKVNRMYNCSGINNVKIKTA